MPAETTAHRMITGVETVPAERGQVDAPDERDLAVDDHQLLVVAMHRPLMRVKRAPHSSAANQLFADTADGRASRREGPQRRSCPQQNPDLDSLSQITKQIAQPRRAIVPGQPEIRREVPARDMDM